MDLASDEATPITFFALGGEEVRGDDIAVEVLLETQEMGDPGILFIYSVKHFKAQVDQNKAFDIHVRPHAPYAPKFCGPLVALTNVEPEDFEATLRKAAAAKWGKAVIQTEMPEAFSKFNLIRDKTKDNESE